MRKMFIRTLVELARQDPRILLLTGDLGYTVLEPFMEKFPKRFFNVGVAEQNMVGLATGLSEAGFIPFLYSITPFAVLRPYEFIRNGPIFHQFPVRIVGVGSGLEYGHNGLSHYGVDDVGIMRLQPGLTLIAPADYQQAQTSLLSCWDLPGPIYYRLGKDEKTTIPGLEGRFELGRAQFIGDGQDLLIICMGSISSEVIAATKMLAVEGISTTVMIISSLNPIPTNDLIKALSQFQLALSVEAHYIRGGLGSLVSEVVAEQDINCQLVRCGIETMLNGITGSQHYLRHVNGLSSKMLFETAIKSLQKIQK